MTEGSRTKRNRHGIPVYDEPPCIGKDCRLPAYYPYREWRLCLDHLRELFTRSYEDINIGWDIRARFERDKANQREQVLAEMKQAAAAERTEQPGVIYYVKNGGHIKIGFTTDLVKRMKAYPPGCELMAVHAGTRPDEQALHKRFAAHRSHGREWYPRRTSISAPAPVPRVPQPCA